MRRWCTPRYARHRRAPADVSWWSSCCLCRWWTNVSSPLLLLACSPDFYGWLRMLDFFCSSRTLMSIAFSISWAPLGLSALMNRPLQVREDPKLPHLQCPSKELEEKVHWKPSILLHPQHPKHRVVCSL